MKEVTMVNEGIKEFIKQTVQILDEIALDSGIDRFGETAKLEFMNFMMFMSLADGRIATKEANMIGEYFDYELNPEKIEFFINKYELDTPAYIEKVPSGLEIALKADREHGAVGTDSSISDLVFNLYRMLGKEVIESDEFKSNRERDEYMKYIGMLQRYLEEN